jgi:hypothetical protein
MRLQAISANRLLALNTDSDLGGELHSGITAQCSVLSARSRVVDVITELKPKVKFRPKRSVADGVQTCSHGEGREGIKSSLIRQGYSVENQTPGFGYIHTPNKT